jgi:hypothetical protein
MVEFKNMISVVRLPETTSFSWNHVITNLEMNESKTNETDETALLF